MTSTLSLLLLSSPFLFFDWPNQGRKGEGIREGRGGGGEFGLE